jgi:exodeoxyribonuclease (lambda-induced)
MKIYKDIKQQTPEWFALKLGKFGSTDAQAVANVGPGLDTLIFEKISELLTGKADSFCGNFDTERGNLLESEARNSFELETGKSVETVGLIELDEYTVCSPDGLVDDDALIEIKCPKDSVFVRYLVDGKVDTKYQWQMQHQLYVSDRDHIFYCVYNPNFKKSLIIKRIERDEKAIEKIKVGIETGKAMVKAMMEKLQ